MQAGSEKRFDLTQVPSVLGMPTSSLESLSLETLGMLDMHTNWNFIQSGKLNQEVT